MVHSYWEMGLKWAQEWRFMSTHSGLIWGQWSSRSRPVCGFGVKDCNRRVLTWSRKSIPKLINFNNDQKWPFLKNLLFHFLTGKIVNRGSIPRTAPKSLYFWLIWVLTFYSSDLWPLLNHVEPQIGILVINGGQISGYNCARLG